MCALFLQASSQIRDPEMSPVGQFSNGDEHLWASIQLAARTLDFDNIESQVKKRRSVLPKLDL